MDNFVDQVDQVDQIDQVGHVDYEKLSEEQCQNRNVLVNGASVGCKVVLFDTNQRKNSVDEADEVVHNQIGNASHVSIKASRIVNASVKRLSVKGRQIGNASLKRGSVNRFRNKRMVSIVKNQRKKIVDKGTEFASSQILNVASAMPLSVEECQMSVENDQSHNAGSVKFVSLFGDQDTIDEGQREDILLKIQPAIRAILYPHQIEGVSFIYEKVNKGCSCILAHGMGMGKTLQSLVLCDIFPMWKIVCVIPVILMSVWQAEVHKYKWKFNTFSIVSKSRTDVINKWNENEGIIFIGYELYMSILKGKNIDMKNALMEPDMLIFDEGHRIKNMDNKMFSTFNSIKCKRRVILTGYPLQNNLVEYWSMMDFLQPNYLGTLQEFKTFFMGPIEKCQCIDSSAEDVQTMKQRVYVLHKLLAKFVHRQSENLAKESLPSLEHNVILVKMTDLQKGFMEQCYSIYGKNALVLYAMTLSLMAHPDMMADYNIQLESKELVGNESDELVGNESEGNNEVLKTDFVFPADYVKDLLQNSPKLELCLLILDECIKHEDKVVIFSQSVNTLNLIEKFLALSKNYKWVKHWNYFRIDGSTCQKDRVSMLKEFNTNKNIILFLMSTRTCALGLNLTIANRIIIFDNCWNPCLDMQSVSRVHRFGQTKPCFVYRLVMDNCLEKSVYERQINKQLLFARVVDASCPASLLSLRESRSVFNITGNKFHDLDFRKEYNDNVMQAVCQTKASIMSVAPFEHQMFLLDTDLQLTDEERVVAMKSFEMAVRTQDDAESSKNENDVLAKGVSLKKMYVEAGRKTNKRRIQADAGEEVVYRQIGNISVGSKSGSVEGQASLESENICTKDTVDEDQGSVEIATTSRYIPSLVWKQQGMEVQNIILTEEIILTKNKNTIHMKQVERVMIIKSKLGKYIQRYNGEIVSMN